jgi:DNA-binding NarL/FixJ family response regulator
MATAAHREGDRSKKKVRILIAVEPLSLRRVMELILGAGSEIQVLARPDDVSTLQRQARRLQPDLLITNARLLGDEARTVLGDIKRVSPHTKIILTDFDARLAGIAGQCGVDLYLEEDLLVRRLLEAVRRLTAKRRSPVKLRGTVRRARWPRKQDAG